MSATQRAAATTTFNYIQGLANSTEPEKEMKLYESYY